MASFEDQINEIDQFIVRAAQSRDLLQRRQDAEAEDILQLADWNATIENIEAMDQRSAEHTATLTSTRVLRDRLQSRLDLQRDMQGRFSWPGLYLIALELCLQSYLYS